MCCFIKELFDVVFGEGKFYCFSILVNFNLILVFIFFVKLRFELIVIFSGGFLVSVYKLFFIGSFFVVKELM